MLNEIKSKKLKAFLKMAIFAINLDAQRHSYYRETLDEFYFYDFISKNDYSIACEILKNSIIKEVK